MSSRFPHNVTKGYMHWVAAVCLGILATGALLSLWKAKHVELTMKSALLQQAQLAAKAVDTSYIEKLSGTEADLDKPEYVRLKEQLHALLQNIPDCRFLYLMGRNPDGQIIFLVDGEPADSPDCSPAGQVYEEVSESVLDAFSRQRANTEGPTTDRWGTWISANVPIIDQRYALENLATPEDAKALVEQAVEFLHNFGEDRLLEELNNPAGIFSQGDLYAFAIDTKMTMLAHPVKPQLVGQDLSETNDWPNEKEISREIRAVALSQTCGWVEYGFENPVSKQVESKRSYIQLVGDVILCAGAYEEGDPVIGVLGMDIEATTWYRLVASKACIPLIPTLPLILLTLLTALLLKRREGFAGRHPAWMSHIEVGFIAVAGLILSAFWAWFVDEIESTNRRAAFAQLAISSTNGIVEVLHRLRDSELEGLGRYLEQNENLTYQAFNNYADYLTSNPAVQAWEWVPAVPAERLAEFQSEVQASMLSHFQVWDQTGQEKRVPVGNRAIYYPVTYLTPLHGNEKVLGFDLGSERVLCNAIEEAQRTRLATASNPTMLVQETNNQLSMLILRPVFNPENTADLLGFVTAVVRMRRILNISGTVAQPASISLELLEVDKSPQELAEYGESVSSTAWGSGNGLVVSRPVFAFGKVFTATARPNSEFNRLYPRRAGLLIAAIGLIITLSILVLASVQLRKREDLEREVRDRTAALSENKARFNQLAEHSRTYTWEIDREGRFTYLSHVVEAVLGFTPEELIGNVHFADLRLKDGREEYLKSALTMIDCAEPFTDHLSPAVTKSGSVIWLSSTGIPMFDEKGNLTGYRGGDTDITERKQIEDQLQESQLRLIGITDSAQDPIVMIDGTGVITFWNPAAERVLGYAQDEAIGRNLHRLIAPERYWHRHDEHYPGFQRTGKGDAIGKRLELEARRKDGSEIDIALSLSAVQLQGEWHAVGIMRDITLENKTKTELVESDLRYNQLAEKSRIIAWEMGLDWTYSYISNVVQQVLGVWPDEIVGKMSFWQLFAEAEQAGVKSALYDAASKQDLLDNAEFKAVSADGQEIWFSVVAIPQLNEAGTLQGYRGSHTDITDRVTAQQALLQTNDQLLVATLRANELAAKAEAASVAKSEFLANMSHEIRTPMNGVIGMTGLLLDTEMTQEQKEYAEIVRTSGESLLTIINDILDFSKIEAGKLDLEVINFDLSSLLDDFASALAVRAQEKGLELFCSIDPAVPPLLMGDPGRLRQVLTNLTGNAIKFTHHGEVAVHAGLAQPAGASESGGQAESLLIRFSVRDTGIGIPAEKCDLLFEKFTQVDASTTRKYGGTGLGLAISKQLAELMGGEIGVISQEGEGSEFWFTARLAVQIETATHEEIVPAELSGVRILIVDDSETSRKILLSRLSAWQMLPLEAESGEIALEILGRAYEAGQPIPVAVVDMQMPGMDGRMLGEAIKADPRLSDMKLVMLTSLGMRGDAEKSSQSGFSGYLTKPLRHPELRSVLSEVLAMRSSSQQGQAQIVTRHSTQKTVSRFLDRDIKILLVEDNLTNQQVASGLLRKMGLQADAVGNGLEAIDVLGTTHYDIVLMDCQMPVLDGYQATEQIRDPHSTVLDHDVTIIAMTANAMQGDKEKCLAVGMDDYVSKPLSPALLAEVLERWITKSATRGQPDAQRASAGDGAASASNQPVTAQAGESASVLPVFDRAEFLTAMLDDEDLATEIALVFLEDTPEQIAGIRAALDAGDDQVCRRLAHTIKGSSSNVSGKALREVAAHMETLAKDGKLAEFAAMLPELERQWVILREMLQAAFPA